MLSFSLIKVLNLMPSEVSSAIHFLQDHSHNLTQSSRKKISIVQVGANSGQEVELYDSLGLEGFHIEPIPEQYNLLEHKCRQSEGQTAINALLSDKHGETVELNIANNDGQSSSILEMKDHKHAYPDIHYSRSTALTSTTIDPLVDLKVIPDSIDILLIDPQGAEELIINGAHNTLCKKRVRSLIVETTHNQLFEGEISFNALCNKLETYDFFLKYAHFGSKGWCNAIYMHNWFKVEHGSADLVGHTLISRGAHVWASSYSLHRPQSDVSRLIDGIRGPDFVYHSELEDCPWIIIDLNFIRKIDRIQIYNRLFCAYRADNHAVHYSLDSSEWTLLHKGEGLRIGGADGNPLILNCTDLEARYIRFSLTDRIFLHLNSIEVWAQS